MRKILPILGFIVILIGFTGCQSKKNSNSEYWRNRAAQVKIGSTRGEVEELLPPCTGVEGFTSGGRQTEIYWVDEDWQVCIAYDSTGYSGGLSSRSPLNKVVVNPVLKEVKMPVPNAGSTSISQSISQSRIEYSISGNVNVPGTKSASEGITLLQAIADARASSFGARYARVIRNGSSTTIRLSELGKDPSKDIVLEDGYLIAIIAGWGIPSSKRLKPR